MPLTNEEATEALLHLSHELGREERALAILGEGNTSTRLEDGTFWVKASGSNLATLAPYSVTRCRFEALLPLLEENETTASRSDAEVDAALMAARVDPQSKKPSVEALFHADLLSLPDVSFIGHTHPAGVNALLCSPRSREFAEQRIFPDEIVCCGVASVWVPYTDPGLALARAIRRAVRAFIGQHGRGPSVVLLENHGLIALGRTPQAVLAATLMAEKAARIWIGAAALGGPQFLTPETIARIAGRPDEHYRQRALNL